MSRLIASPGFAGARSNANALRRLIVVAALAACSKGKEPKKQETPPPIAKPQVASDPQCATKAKELEAWLEQFELETASYEVDFGYTLQVIDRAPEPVPQKIDAVNITSKSIQAFDVSEHNHVGNNLATPKAIADKLKAIHAMAAGPDERGAAPNDQLRVDVDKDATWGAVASVVEAAVKAGYKQIVFGFTATSKVPQPAGVEAWSTTQEAVKQAGDALEKMHEQCKPWGRALLNHVYKDSEIENAKAVAHEVATAIAECNCAVAPDQVRAQMWKAKRWHQARPRVGVVMHIEGPEWQFIPAPAKAPWSEAYGKMVDAATPGAPPTRLVAK